MDWLKLLNFDWLKTRYVIFVLLVCCISLYVPDSTIIGSRLTSIKELYGGYISLATIASGCLILVRAGSYLLWKVRQVWNNFWLCARIRRKLQNLDLMEQAVLREFIVFGVSSVKLPFDNSTVAGLCNDGIIYPISRFGNFSPYGMMLPFRISSIAQNLCLPEHVGITHLLLTNESATPRLSPNGKRWVDENRPFDSFRYERSL